ncbi:MAG: M20/M25/M40 family metallo-hydrolase [Pirellulales bacterium]|nr:M20/M25/M40 family metallo-hydrolase [Pirellulales bacterium]
MGTFYTILQSADLQLGLPLRAAIFGLVYSLLPTVAGSHCVASEAHAVAAAMDSITSDALQDIVETLAADSFEGRETGGRGGRAAGVYIGEFFQKHKLRGGGSKGGYYQPFNSNSRNILGYIPGSDPELKEQFVFVTAHYDHVGYGSASNSNGPTGYIHNGADDNASGVSGVLETIDAFTNLPHSPKRSLMFALWDAEEAGLLGSKHWLDNPTVPLNKVAAAINVDMIGRLRHERAMVYGCRTSYGFRQLVSRQNEPIGLTLDFNWLMKAESDHQPFFASGIPVMMLHTGLHDDYHRPSDDADKINQSGLRQLSQLMFRMAVELADMEEKPKFRTASRNESPATRPLRERLLPALPARLGFSWNEAKSNDGVLYVASVASGGAAAKAGLQPGDRIVKYAGKPFVDADEFRGLVLSTRGTVTMTINRAERDLPFDLKVQPSGPPVRLGITWQVDDAEPGAVMLIRVIPGSAADRAGLHVYDRIYEVNGQRFATSDEFHRLVNDLDNPLDLLVETRGKLRHTEVERSGFVTDSEPASTIVGANTDPAKS